MSIQMRDKRAVSIMIGYILLITFAVVIAGVVFQWLKTYVPREGIDCPDGVSLYILEDEFDPKTSELSLTLRNNGKFSIGGIFIYYSDDASQEIAPNDLSEKVNSGETFINPGLKFVDFDPGDPDRIFKFDVTGIDSIYAIEMTPIRWQEEKNRLQIVSCTNAKTKKIIDLDLVSDGGVPEIEIIQEKLPA